MQLETGDYTVGNVTRLTYALTNILFAKKESSREIARVTLRQTYYSDENAAQYDRNYQSSYSNQAAPTKFSAVAFNTRVTPTDRFQAEFRTEWDPTVHTLKTMSGSGNLQASELVQVSGSWNRRRFIPELPGFDDPAQATHSVSAAATTPEPDQPSRRQLLVRLRLPARFFPAAAHPGVLQRAVLRSRDGIPDVQLPGRPGRVGATGQALQHLLQPRRHRDLLELPRCPRWRRAAPLTSLSR